MSFISEKTIDSVLEMFAGTPERFEASLQTLRQEQPVVIAYLFSESFEAFTEKERDFLMYLTLVIWEAFQHTEASRKQPITEDQLAKAEGNNWNLMQPVKAKKLRDRFSPFFQDYHQEDLLAFVEDALLEDEAGYLTQEGREHLFLTAKTVIDCLSA